MPDKHPGALYIKPILEIRQDTVDGPLLASVPGVLFTEDLPAHLVRRLPHMLKAGRTVLVITAADWVGK